MKLAKYIYMKYIFSLSISLSTALIIFYIFSLIGNLGENLSFTSILNLSLVNSLQITTYIPSFIFFLSIILLIIFLKSKNELLPIKEYFSSYKIILIFLPIIILFAFFEINKNNATNYLDDLKLSFFKTNENFNSKVIIEENEASKSYMIINGFNIKDNSIQDYQKYIIINDQITGGEYSEDVYISENNLISNKLIYFDKNEIKSEVSKKVILKNFMNILDNKFVIHKNEKNIFYNFKLSFIFKFFYFILFFCCLFIILFNKKVVDRKNNFFIPCLICVLLLIYSLIIHSISLSVFYDLVQILAFLFILLNFIKFYYYE